MQNTSSIKTYPPPPNNITSMRKIERINKLLLSAPYSVNTFVKNKVSQITLPDK